MPLKKGKSKKIQKENFEELTESYNRTGKIGNSKPKTKKKAREQIAAIVLNKSKKKK